MLCEVGNISDYEFDKYTYSTFCVSRERTRLFAMIVHRYFEFTIRFAFRIGTNFLSTMLLRSRHAHISFDTESQSLFMLNRRIAQFRMHYVVRFV